MVIDYKFIIVACIMICFDVITGVIASFITGTFQSSVMRKGGLHKLLLVVVLMFGVSLDVCQHLINLGFSLPACATICSYVTLMEILSCVENINKGFPGTLPKALTDILYNTAKEHGIDVKEDEECKK